MADSTSSVPTTAGAVQGRRAKKYNRARRRLAVLNFGLSVALVLALLFAGWSAGLRDAAWRHTSNVWLAILIYAVLVGVLSKAVSTPVSFYSSFILEHRYGLSNMTLPDWIKDSLKSTALSAAFGIAAVEILYFALRRFPGNWWLFCWAAFALFSILLTVAAPVLLFPLFYKFSPLQNEALRDRLLLLSERAGARVRSVMEWKLSAKSRKANAALVGLGKTRRIILADTLLHQYSPDEIEAVLAHELAHHVYNHIWKGMSLQLGLSFIAFWAANQALLAFDPYFGYRGISDFANLPLLLATSVALSLLVLPLVNGFSRRSERQADDFALHMIPDTGPFISGMSKLAEQNLAERQPNALIEFFFHSHPSIGKRIRRAEQFQRAA